MLLVVDKSKTNQPTPQLAASSAAADLRAAALHSAAASTSDAHRVRGHGRSHRPAAAAGAAAHNQGNRLTLISYYCGRNKFSRGLIEVELF